MFYAKNLATWSSERFLLLIVSVVQQRNAYARAKTLSLRAHTQRTHTHLKPWVLQSLGGAEPMFLVDLEGTQDPVLGYQMWQGMDGQQ